MKVLILLLSLFLVGDLYSATLDSLIKQLRLRADEEKISTSIFTDSQAISWINLAQDKIANLTGGFEDAEIFVYDTAAENNHDLNDATRFIKNIFFYHQLVWREVPKENYKLFFEGQEDPRCMLDLNGVVVRDTVLGGLKGDTRILFPVRFSGIENVLIQTDDIAYPVPSIAEADSASYSGTAYTIHRFAPDSAELVLLNRDGFMLTSQSIVYSEDSLHYTLDVSFRKAVGAIVRHEDEWKNVLENPLFAYDTNAVFQYFTSWFDNGSKVVPVLYLAGEYYSGDTVRLNFTRSIEDYDTLLVTYNTEPNQGDSIKFVVSRNPADMTLGSAECNLPDRDEVWLIEEAYSFYLQANRDIQSGQANQALIRQDMQMGTQVEGPR